MNELPPEKDLVSKFIEAASEAASVAEVKLASLAVTAVRWFMGRRRRKVAVLVDDAFQAIGPDEAAMYVKSLLGLTEYPGGLRKGGRYRDHERGATE